MRALALFCAGFLIHCASHVVFDDGSNGDGGPSDGGPTTDGAPNKDGGVGNDGAAGNDGGGSDSGTLDASAADSSDASPPLLGPPCSHGPGFVAWKFHYNGSTSAITDVYSLPDKSNWQAVPAYATMFSDALHGGGIQIGGGNWILIRYSVSGMSTIKSATLSVYGRSYDTTTSGSFNAWSPIYGDNASPTN